MIQRLPWRLRPSAVRFSCETQRGLSYDKSALTNEALQAKIEAGLDADKDDHNLRVNTDSNTVSTAAGDLPASPLFDPDWMRARRRQRKDNPGKPIGRFRKLLASNPYAQALTTPIRRCPNTAVSLPRFFLQDFELVKHPETNLPWWAPGPLAFEGLETKNAATAGPSEKSGTAGSESLSEQVQSPDESISSTTGKRPRRSPITNYTLGRKAVIDTIGGRNKRFAALLLAPRSGMALAPDTRDPIWRRDMGDVLLEMMQRQAVDALIALTQYKGQKGKVFIQSCKDWDEIKDRKPRGCVLWLPNEENASKQYTTLDIEEAKYGQKMVVHNLHWLLGASEVWRLRTESDVFRSEFLILQQAKTTPVMKLHLLLWRLQGYLAEPPEPKFV